MRGCELSFYVLVLIRWSGRIIVPKAIGVRDGCTHSRCKKECVKTNYEQASLWPGLAWPGENVPGSQSEEMTAAQISQITTSGTTTK